MDFKRRSQMGNVLPNKQALTVALYNQFLQNCSKAFQLCLDRKKKIQCLLFILLMHNKLLV